MNRRILLFAASVSCWAAMITPASGQEFQHIAGLLTQVASGREEVWGINAAHNVYRFNPGTMNFAQVPGQLTQIAVGGGSLLQSDVVWGFDTTGQVFQYNFSTKKLVAVPISSPIRQITVGDGYTDSCHAYEVWGVGVNASAFVYRYNFCTSVFDPIPTGPLIVGLGLKISTGGSDVWALDNFEHVFQYNFVTQQWVSIPGSLVQIAVGENDVWGINDVGHAFRYQPATGFVQMDGSATFSQIAAGGDGVWGLLSPGNTVVRFSPDEQTAVTVPGVLTQLSVGYGAGIWGVNSTSYVYSFVRP